MHWRFGRFQLDCESACLWEGEQRLTLRPKTFDLLVYWVAHAGELVRISLSLSCDAPPR
jgi:DNA-binding response OmpR family regulator